MKPIQVLRRRVRRGKQVAFILAGTGTWTVPIDWNSANNKIRCLGAGSTGGNASSGVGGQGGGGGGYSEITNLALTPNAIVSCQVPAKNSGGTCWFSGAATILANSAAAGSNAGASTTGAVGTIKNGGGNGGGSGGATGSGGGGAGGPDAAGGAVSGVVGGAGNNGLNGGGAGGAQNANGAAGNMWTSTFGQGTAGSGGGGGNQNTANANGTTGGQYGGGGGGGDQNTGVGGAAGDGIIVVEWTPGTLSSSTTWNPADKEASVVLSNGNLTAANPSGAGPHNVRTIASYSTGKWAVRFHIDVVGVWLGIIDGSQSISAGPGAGFYLTTGGSLWVNSVNQGALGARVANDVVDIAFDADAKKMWIAINGAWQTLSSNGGDPNASGAGWSVTDAQPWFPFVECNATSAQATLQANSIPNFTSVI